MSEKVIGIDIGGTHIRVGLVDDKYNLLSCEIYKTQIVLKDADVTKKLAEIITEYCDKYNSGLMPLAVSIGFPSTIDKSRKVVVSTPNIKECPDNLQLVDKLEPLIGTKVFVNRDVNNLMSYDLKTFNIKKDESALGFYLGTGLGNAVYVNGDYLLGANGVAGELGHIPLLSVTDTCSCGNVGCVETIASGSMLAKLQREKFPDVSLSDIFTKCGDTPEIKRFIEVFALTMATEINIFDPSSVIIGGGVVFMNDFPKEELINIVKSRLRKPYPFKSFKYEFSEPKQENGVIGAGIYALELLEV